MRSVVGISGLQAGEDVKTRRRPTHAVRYGPLLAALCRAYALPEPVAEWPVCAGRRWRFDFAWVPQRVALEIQGGIFTQGRHTRGAALLREHEKLNRAASLNWVVLFATPRTVPSVMPALQAALRRSGI